MSVNSLLLTINNRYTVDDIYLGIEGKNPKKSKFTINKEDYSGLPKNIDDDEGIFIGFDSLCESPYDDNIGQWIFRTRANKLINLPTSVIVTGEDDYTTSYTLTSFEHTFKGTITTDGDFSSVLSNVRVDNVCNIENSCKTLLRYCANDLLENG
jgi:hypothetical protein